MKNKIFTKYFILAAITVIVFIFIGGVFAGLITDMLHNRNQQNNLAPVFMAKLIDRIDSGHGNKVASIQQIEQMQSGKINFHIVLYDSEGRAIYNQEYSRSPHLSSDFLAQFRRAYDFHVSNVPPDGREMRPPGPPGGFFPMILGNFFRPPHPPRHLFENTIIRLDGSPAYYIGFEPAGPPPAPPEGREAYLPILGPLFLLLSLLLGVAVAISLIYASVRKKVSEADWVLSEIQRGNLKARFRVGRRDEFGEAMMRFNKMADEIEALVEHLKFVESARNKMLQELAHDLRTPVASLKNLLETIESQNEKLTPELRKELSQLSLREVDYFAQLVEDLLLLAQVDEPKYRVESHKINMLEILDEVLNDCLSRPAYKNKDVRVIKNYLVSQASIAGSETLIYRMFRNAIENALSFTQEKIKLNIESFEPGKLRIEIIDDGPGLSEDQLASFGERKLSRQIISREKSQRLSLGLGSVIMKKICRIHRGDMSIRNIRENQLVRGAVLTLEFEDVTVS